MGLNKKPSIEHYWKMDPIYYTGLFHKIQISYNRFSTLLRCWHFADFQPENDNFLYKIQPLIDKIMDRFRQLYIPAETIVVDESQIKHQGRLRIKTYNPSKAHKYGIKIYKMCCPNSYTWSYIVYAGTTGVIDNLDKPGSVVVKLCQPLLNEGRILFADNYYTSLSLANYLKDRQTDLCGTLRKNRKDLPKDIINKKIAKGQTIGKQLGNYVTVLKWHDKRDVLMISTCHDDEMTATKSWNGEIKKPSMVIDYNDAKKGIDVADQLGSYYSPLRKSMTWYKKIAFDLLFQATIVNARVVYNECTGSSITVLQVQEAMIRYWIGEEARKKITSKPPSKRSLVGSIHSLSEIPRKNGKLIRRRCCMCYAARKNEGIPLSAKQVHTECKQCSKAYCLSCYNKAH